MLLGIRCGGQCGPGLWLGGVVLSEVDIRSAYRMVPVHPQGQTVALNVVGWAAACGHCPAIRPETSPSKLFMALEWIAKSRGLEHSFQHFCGA